MRPALVFLTAAVPMLTTLPAAGGNPNLIFEDGFDRGDSLPWSDAVAGPGWCADPDTLDDLEDGDLGICHHPDRFGAWYTISDQTPGADVAVATAGVTGGAPGSTTGLLADGGPVTSWGGGAGFSLDAEDGLAPVDVSGYTGLRFWLRVSADTAITFKLPTVATVPDGGVCSSCNDHYAFTVAATTTWQQFDIDFTDLAQQGWGDPVALNLTSAIALQWYTGIQNQPWELWMWIDDVELR